MASKRQIKAVFETFDESLEGKADAMDVLVYAAESYGFEVDVIESFNLPGRIVEIRVEHPDGRMAVTKYGNH